MSIGDERPRVLPSSKNVWIGASLSFESRRTSQPPNSKRFQPLSWGEEESWSVQLVLPSFFMFA